MSAKHLTKNAISHKLVFLAAVVALAIIAAFSICAASQAKADEQDNKTEDAILKSYDSELTQNDYWLNENDEYVTPIGETGFTLTGDHEAVRGYSEGAADFYIDEEGYDIQIYTDDWLLKGDNPDFYIGFYNANIALGDLACWQLAIWEPKTTNYVVNIVDGSKIKVGYFYAAKNINSFSILGNSTIELSEGFKSENTKIINFDGPNFIFHNNETYRDMPIFNFLKAVTIHLKSGSIKCEVSSGNKSLHAIFCDCDDLKITKEYVLFLSHYSNAAICFNKIEAEGIFLGSMDMISYGKRETVTNRLIEKDEDNTYSSRTTKKVLAVDNTPAKTVRYGNFCSISGRTIDTNDVWQPVPGAYAVYCPWSPLFWDYIPNWEISAVTDWLGNFKLEGIEENMLPGVVRVYRLGYKPAESWPIWGAPEGEDTIPLYIEMTPIPDVDLADVEINGGPHHVNFVTTYELVKDGKVVESDGGTFNKIEYKVPVGSSYAVYDDGTLHCSYAFDENGTSSSVAYTVKAVAEEGYVLDKWNINGEDLIPGKDYILKANDVMGLASYKLAEQPVPPVPPAPGPTPVNPGGGIAQTGDNTGYALVIFAMVALLGAGVLTGRKLYSR